jgi:hypothetical protein
MHFIKIEEIIMGRKLELILCDSCQKKGYADCGRCVWEDEAIYHLGEAQRYRDKKNKEQHKKFVSAIKKKFNGIEID